MRKKRGLSIVERAIIAVPTFEKVHQKLYQQVVLRNQNKSRLENYIRRIALFVLHFEKLPEEISEDEINEYLTSLALDPKSPSRSSFKHMVYGLRYYCRMVGMNKKAIDLPAMNKDTRLPVILNRSELKTLFKAPNLLKHRIILSLIYSAGLRGQEVVNLKLGDIDFERMTIHIRQSKYKKDRIVPLSTMIARGLKQYISSEHPHIWLFNGKRENGQYSTRGLSWIMREALKRTDITKAVNLHSLRHTYATHLLEHIKVDGTHVSFWAKDYRDSAKRKISKLKGEEFLRRFCQHVMPNRFVRIRRYGIYNPIVKRNLALQFTPEDKPTVETLLNPPKAETKAERIIRLTGFDAKQCPHCQQGRMIRIEELPRIRSPAQNRRFLLQQLFY